MKFGDEMLAKNSKLLHLTSPQLTSTHPSPTTTNDSHHKHLQFPHRGIGVRAASRRFLRDGMNGSSDGTDAQE